MSAGPSTAGKYVNLPTDVVTVTAEGIQVDRDKCFHHWNLYKSTPLAKGKNGFVFSVRATKTNSDNEFVMKVQLFKEKDSLYLRADQLVKLNQQKKMPFFTTNVVQLNRMQIRAAKSNLEVRNTALAGNLGIAPELIDYWKCLATDGKTQLLFMVMRKVKNAETFHDFWIKYKSPSAAILDELACAIEKLHENNIFHLDLHGHNILIEQAEPAVMKRLWIIDFGFTANDKDPLMDYDQLGIRNSFDVLKASKGVPPRTNTDFGAKRKELYLKNKAEGIETLHQPYLEQMMTT